MKNTVLFIGVAALGVSATLAGCAQDEAAPRRTAEVMQPAPAPAAAPPAARPTSPAAPRETATARPPAATSPAADKVPDTNLARMIGSDVRNSQGQTIGEVESVLLDQTGKVDAVVVSVGGFMGIGARDVALKWSDLDVSDGGARVVVDMTEMQLKAMPEYRTPQIQTQRDTANTARTP